jgi:hypothetical protein
LDKACKVVAAEHGLPVDHTGVRRLALLRIKHDRLISKEAAGANVPLKDMLVLEQAMADVTAALPALIPVVTVEILHSLGTCPACGHCAPPSKEPPPEPEPVAPVASSAPSSGQDDAIPPASVDGGEKTNMPMKRPAPAKPELPYAPARDFHAGVGIVKGDCATNEWLGGFVNPLAGPIGGRDLNPNRDPFTNKRGSMEQG